MKRGNGRPAKAAKQPSQASVRETLQFFWDSPFPATLQDASFRLVDVNDAYVDFTGFTRAEMIGRDPLELQPPQDHAVTLERRAVFGGPPDNKLPRTLSEGRLIDARGAERWFSIAGHVLADASGAPLYLAVLQDMTTEHAARERADHSVRELDDWFDLSPMGMVLFDQSGLLVRNNVAFDQLAGGAPVSLAEGPPALAGVLAWDGDGEALGRLQPGSRPIESSGWVAPPGGGSPRRLRAIVRCYLTAAGERRFMGIVEDRSVEEERDLAQMQIGALMDTAGVGIATFQESAGWVRQPAKRGSVSVVPHHIGRDMVTTETMPEYERLQQALERTERAEVRYAIRHPELGLRWLLTRIEPATLASGKKTASVITLDITDQQRSQQRSEQLLREMTTILESAAAGIAYLRGGKLVRCNRNFETMLRLPASGVAGLSLAELLSRHPQAAGMAGGIRNALRGDATYESEFAFDEAGEASTAESRWYSLSVRGVGGSFGDDEAIAVLSDVTRMKAQQLQLETAARDRESMARRTRAIFDSVQVGIITVGPAGIEWMNLPAQRMLGAELAELLEQPISVVATADADHPFRRIHAVDEMVEGRAETFECRIRARDGREFRVVGNAVVTGREVHSRQLTYALLDIEQRRQAEAAVSEAQASLRRVIEAAPLAIALLDARTLTIVQINEVAARTVCDAPADLVGLAPEQLFSPEVAPIRRRDMETALASSEVTTREYRSFVDGETRIWDARYLPLAASPGDPPDQLLLVATDVTEQRAAQEARLEAAIAQREMLVREVHHRIKNNLQGVAGLLQQIAQRKPEVANAIDEVVGQVQAIAQVYGLQVGATGPLSMVRVLEAITGSVQRTFGRTIRCDVGAGPAAEWTLPEVEAIPIALTLNELLTNAVKHSPAGAADEIVCTLDSDDDGVRVAISNSACLPGDFSLARIPNGVSGLGLVRALLPRRSATLRIEQAGAQRVVATVALGAPVVARVAAA